MNVDAAPFKISSEIMIFKKIFIWQPSLKKHEFNDLVFERNDLMCMLTHYRILVWPTGDAFHYKCRHGRWLKISRYDPGQGCGEFPEHWVRVGVTLWMGRQFIADHHPDTHSHLGAILSSQSTCQPVFVRNPEKIHTDTGRTCKTPLRW